MIWWRRWWREEQDDGRHARTDIERRSAELTGKLDQLIGRLENVVESIEREKEGE